jgi:hypothetical protein
MSVIMKKTIFILLMLIISRAHSGTWNRLDLETLSFEGEIKSNEYQRFSKKFDSKVKTIYLNSDGGVTSEAMKIALDIVDLDITVIVNNWCLSSCANYLFLAGKKRIIQKGIVGYHGNVKACFGDNKWDEVEADFQSQGISKEDILNAYNYFQAEIKVEEKFLEKIGVSQKLFDRSCELDKGLNDGKVYEFLLPTPETFSKYGVFNIIGEQDTEVIKAYPGSLAHD